MGTSASVPATSVSVRPSWSLNPTGQLQAPVRPPASQPATLVGVELATGIAVDDERLAEFCRANGLRRLGLFGSTLRGEHRTHSDIDLLVEFEAGRTPGLLRLATLELELGALLGREVDLRTPADLSHRFRDEVVANARVLYEAA